MYYNNGDSRWWIDDKDGLGVYNRYRWKRCTRSTLRVDTSRYKTQLLTTIEIKTINSRKIICRVREIVAINVYK